MNMDEITFAQTGWDSALEELSGGSISAVRLLSMFESDSDEALDEAFLDLEEAGVCIDLAPLPRSMGSGEEARRLRQEQQLAETGDLLTGLDENDPLRLYLDELASIPVCGDLAVLAMELAEEPGDRALRSRIVNLSLSRVVELAKEYTGRGVLLLDLIQEGSLGLWQATAKYDGGDFERCRDWWIRQYMAEAVVRQARASGVVQKMRQAAEDYREVDERLLAELGRTATVAEIAEALHMSVEETEAVRKLLENARLVGKAHATKEPDQEQPEDDQAVENTAYYQTRERVDSLMSGLDQTEMRVVTMRYGLDGKAPMTADEVGRRLNLTVSEVVALETAALAKMRHSGE